MTERKLEANRRNALKSTGPRTPEGKDRVRRNAIKHGMRTVSLAVPVLEKDADWKAHRELVLEDLSPAGYMETVLAERIAATLWRLERVVRYEREAISLDIEDEGEEKQTLFGTEKSILHLKEEARIQAEWSEAAAALLGSPDNAPADPGWASILLDEMAKTLKLPEDYYDSVDFSFMPEDACLDSWPGWTLSRVKEVGAEMVELSGRETTVEEVLSATLRSIRLEHCLAKAAYEKKLKEVTRARRGRLLLPEDKMDKVNRYETTLERSLFRTLHELQRLQAFRTGGMAPPVLDVDVSVSEAS